MTGIPATAAFTARSIGGIVGREVTCDPGSERTPVATPESGAAISIRFPDTALPPLWIGFSPALVSFLSSPPQPAAEVEAAAPNPEQEPEEQPRRRSSVPPTMDLILDVELAVSISFGKTELPMKDVLKLTTGSIVELKTGVTKDGRITAKAGRIWFDTGAFAGSGPGVASVATLVLAGPYKIPNLYLEGFAVYTNKTNCGSFRAPSGPQANFAVESQMDIIADALELDPLEFRLRNIVREGDEGPTGQVLNGVGLEECLLKATAAIGWQDRRPGPGRGKGLACGWWTTTGGSSGVYVKINPDGTVALNTGAAEIGTAAITGAAQILAEELGIDLTDISVVAADTFSTPFDFGAQGSRTAFAVGNACLAAAADLKHQIFALAAGQLGVEPDALTLADKHVAANGKRLSLADLGRLSQQTGGGLIAHGTFIAPPTPYDTKRVEGHVYPAFHSPSFHAHAVDLSVDPETGEVTIHKYVVAQDVGFAINPTYIEGQIEGGVAQGLGQTLSEEIIYEGGRVLNPNLTDYKMPTTLDVPRVESILVQHPSLAGPYGAKGVGEPPNIEPPAAVANAVAAATGVRITSLPITAEKIALGLVDARAGGA